MKAVRLNEWGQETKVEDVPQPPVGSDEVLVRVQAASVNPIDWKIGAGYLQGMLTVPRTMGTDFAGDVVSVGSDVKNLKAGDAVYGIVGVMGTNGTFAEYTVAKASEIALKPKTLDYTEAAAVPLAALAAWAMLFIYARLKSGERVLIQGAGGGVGAFATQFAKIYGATVVGTASTNTIDFCKEIGVDQPINHADVRFEDVTEPVDIVLDLVGGEVLDRSFSVLKKGGRLVTIVGQIPEGKAEQFGVQAVSGYAQPTTEDLKTIADLIDSGKIKISLNCTFPFEQAQAGTASQARSIGCARAISRLRAHRRASDRFHWRISESWFAAVHHQLCPQRLGKHGVAGGRDHAALCGLSRGR